MRKLTVCVWGKTGDWEALCIDPDIAAPGSNTEPRRGKGRHRIYEKGRGAERRSVSVPFHGSNVDLKPGTLNSIIRRSGLDRNLFR